MKDPAFLFYSQDFITGTQFLTDEQVGKYIRLLCAQHVHGKLTEKQVSMICGGIDPEITAKLKRDENGLYFNERLDNEITRRKEYCESRRKNKTTYDKHMINICSKDEEHMETETETITITNNINSKEDFENSVSDYKHLLEDSYNEFIEYWCEPSKSGKLRYQSEKFFDVKRRVNTWIKNKLKYGNTKTSSPTAASTKRMSDLASWVNS